MLHKTLFREDPYEDLEEKKQEKIRQVNNPHVNSAIEELPEISEDEFVEQAIDEIGFNIPSFDYDRLQKEEYGSPGNEGLRLKLLVKGNIDLLELPPSDDISPIDIDNVNGQWIEWRVSVENKTGEEVSQEVEDKLDKMQAGLDALKQRLEAANGDIEEQLREEYQERIEKQEENRDTLDNIDITTPDEKED